MDWEKVILVVIAILIVIFSIWWLRSCRPNSQDPGCLLMQMHRPLMINKMDKASMISAKQEALEKQWLGVISGKQGSPLYKAVFAGNAAAQGIQPSMADSIILGKLSSEARRIVSMVKPSQ